MSMEEKEAKQAGGVKPGPTRRKWLIDIGKAAALAGLAGKTLPLRASESSAQANAEAGAGKLLPGLIQPSSEHMGNALMNDARFRMIPPGCQVDYVRPRSGPFVPQFFSTGEYRVIHRMTELMLGESAPAKGGSQNEENIVDEVAEWIDLRTHSYAGVREAAGRLTPEQVALAKAYDGGESLKRLKESDPQKTYRAGLAWIAAESHRMYQSEFLALREEQQTALLDAISDEHAPVEAANEGAHFFRQLKDDIVAGFYTSRIGLEELDDKNHGFYPESPGCPSGGLNSQNK